MSLPVNIPTVSTPMDLYARSLCLSFFQLQLTIIPERNFNFKNAESKTFAYTYGINLVSITRKIQGFLAILDCIVCVNMRNIKFHNTCAETERFPS